MQAVLTSTLGRARELLALVLPFAPDAIVIYDPNATAPDGIDILSFPTDPEEGFHIVPVDASVDNSISFTYGLYGHVNGSNIVMSPSRQNTIHPSEIHVFVENVGELDHEFSVLDLQNRHGHPIYNDGIKYGPNLVAIGDSGAYDAELTWSSRTFDQKQEQS